MTVIKKISELEQMPVLSDVTHIIMEENGTAKRFPAKELIQSRKEKSDRYDLKEGYGYQEDVIPFADGDARKPGYHIKTVDFIPVRAGLSYTMYGIGYTLYDDRKNMLGGYMKTGLNEPVNEMMEFTPEVNGFVRLTINSPSLDHARFCLTSEKNLDQEYYYPATSPFVDPRIPCNVHLYGDSNSEGFGLVDTSKAWSNRLGALITSMPTEYVHNKFNMFAATLAADTDPHYGKYGILGETGYASVTAYTKTFKIQLSRVGEIQVKIDGQDAEPITSDNPDSATFFYHTISVEEGLHKLELFGVSGTNEVGHIISEKSRNFTNHAVYGYMTNSLPKTPEGNIVIVMFGTNDRMLSYGATRYTLGRFYNECKKVGAIPYFFTPIPTAVSGEESTSYKCRISDVIAQLPSDCINIYKDLQLIQVLSGENLYSDNVHLTQKGHKLLYAIAASKLQLAAKTSELMEEG